MPLSRTPGPPIFIGQEVNTYANALHKALDELLEGMRNGVPGGEQIIVDQEDGTTFRITLCDWKGQSPCQFCGGTGSSHFNQNRNS